MCSLDQNWFVFHSMVCWHQPIDNFYDNIMFFNNFENESVRLCLWMMSTFRAISERTTNVRSHNRTENQISSGLLTTTSTAVRGSKYRVNFVPSNSSRRCWRPSDQCFNCDRRYQNDISVSLVAALFSQQFNLSLTMGAFFFPNSI